MPNVVLDANVIVSAALKPASPPERAVQRARSDSAICLSQAVLDEIREVLARPKFHAAISDGRREQILELLTAAARMVVPTEAVNDCRDKKDNKYLELALAAAADVIVSGDPDLLDLDP